MAPRTVGGSSSKLGVPFRAFRDRFKKGGPYYIGDRQREPNLENYPHVLCGTDEDSKPNTGPVRITKGSRGMWQQNYRNESKDLTFMC